MRDFREWQTDSIFEKLGMTDQQICVALADNGQIEKVNWEIWTANAMDARKYDVPFVDELYNTKRGPVVMCGAGPSLKKNAEHLKELYRQGYEFIATDRALKDVVDMGIKPVLTVTTECQPECGDFLKAAGKDDVVVVGIHSCAETRAELVARGCKMYHMAYMAPSPMFRKFVNDLWGREVGCARSGYIVGHIAVDIAFWMGYEAIYTIGNDLCYDDPYSCIEDTAILPDGGNAYIRRLPDKRWTFQLFEESAKDFHSFVVWHPDVVFQDLSGGIMCWPKKDIRELAGAVKDIAVPA